MVIDAQLHLWTGRLRYEWLRRPAFCGQLPPDDRDAVLGGTAARFYALRIPPR